MSAIHCELADNKSFPTMVCNWLISLVHFVTSLVVVTNKEEIDAPGYTLDNRRRKNVNFKEFICQNKRTLTIPDNLAYNKQFVSLKVL